MRRDSSAGIWLVEGTDPSLVQSEPCYAVYGAGAVAFSCDDGLVAIGRPHLADAQWTLHAAAAQGYGAQWWPVQYRPGKQQLERLKQRGRRRR